MNPETLKAMKEELRLAEWSKIGRLSIDVESFAALIAEVERQAGEIERLREDLRILTKGRFIQS